MKLTRIQANEIFVGLGFASAPTWDLSKIERMTNAISKQYDSESLGDIEDGKILELAREVLKVLLKGDKVIVAKGNDEDEEAPPSKKAGKGKKKVVDEWTQTIDCRWLRWDHFEGRLTTFLRAQAEANDRFVIVSGRHPHRFVQFAAHIRASKYSPDLLRSEAISNRFLGGEERLSRSTQSTLKQLGWKPPNTRIPNFWRTLRIGADRAEVSAVAVRTLREAFGITSPKSLSIECGSF